jgi:hypothetical protein
VRPLHNKLKTYFAVTRQNLLGKPEQVLGKKHEKIPIARHFAASKNRGS